MLRLYDYWESNAILFALAEGTPWMSEDPWERAQALQWMFFEQYSHEPNIAVVRYTIADIALYAYTHVAHEGKFDMTQYPAIQAWLKRVVAQERYIGLEQAVGSASS